MPLWMLLVAVVLLSASLVAVVLAWRNRTAELDAARTAETAARADLESVQAQLVKIRRKLVGTELENEQQRAELGQQKIFVEQLQDEVVRLGDLCLERSVEISNLEHSNRELTGQLAGARGRAKRKEKQSGTSEPVHHVKEKIQAIYPYPPVNLQSQSDELF